MTPSWVEELAVWAAVASAVATGISAYVVAVQAKHTRESAEASQEAVKVANETLRESQLARLDASAPQLFVNYSETPYADATAIKHEPGSIGNESAPGNYVFRLPRDGDWQVGINIDVSIKNDGPRTIQLRVSPGMLIKPARYPRNNIILAPGETVEGFYRITRSLQEWVDIARERAKGNAGPEHVFEVSYIGTGDSDVMEFHRINTGGTLVAPVPNEDGAWTVADIFIREMKSSLQPTERVYWKSRKRNEKFE